MDTDISSWPRNRRTIGGLAEAIAAARPRATILFALRVIELERIAWREGRPHARLHERHAVAAFLRICLHVLRPGDLVAHESGCDVLVAALVPQTPLDADADLHRTARAVLSEIARRFAQATGMALEYGWTIVEPGDSLDGALRTAIGSALVRGRRERERFEFFATLGHEMRTPLMAISGYVQTLIERDLTSETTRAFLETTQVEALRLQRLVDSMYELSLMDLNEALPGGARCDLQIALERAADAIHPFAGLRGARVKICDRVKRTIPLAGERAVILFNNVLENAVKHGRPGGSVEIRLREDDAGVTIYIDDDGAGVAEHERDRIFERGVRGTRTSAPGSGFGLAIVDGMLARIGGDVGVTQSPLGGARFIIRIPSHAKLPASAADCAWSR